MGRTIPLPRPGETTKEYRQRLVTFRNKIKIARMFHAKNGPE